MRATSSSYGGIIYLVLWIYGMVVDLDGSANFVSLNVADNSLHFVLGVGMIGLGAMLGRTRARLTITRFSSDR